MKIFKFKGGQADLSMLLVSAERYALGRRTYIVSWTCDVIKNNLKILTETDKKVMIRDIESAINYGDSCDENDWKELLKKLNLFEIIVAAIEIFIGAYFIDKASLSTMFFLLAGYHTGKRIIWREK